MDKAKTTWGIGSYPEMAEQLEPVAKHAIGLVEIVPGITVLDVGCGTGTFARMAAERGGEAVGLDAEPALLEIARSLDRHGSRWAECDFAGLAVDDGGFDLVASLFGVMYAQDHDAAAIELARACAPGGTLLLSAWTPESFMPAFGRAVGKFLPSPPKASGPPTRWGSREQLEPILAPVGFQIDHSEERELHISFRDLDQATAFMIRTAGHIVAERERLERAGEWGLLRLAAAKVVADYSIDAADEVVLPMRYLLAQSSPRG